MRTKFITFRTASETAAEAERAEQFFKSRTILAQSLSVSTKHTG